ncbi:MAG TPA: 4Fe-4S binding protein [Firmicutes bacterium]|nr:4Fe-4S binding protein [Candidatus Fermentithermobacillaceae bacterium]
MKSLYGDLPEKDSLLSSGIPSVQDLDGVLPPAEARKKGPVAVLECFQKIPCDPCGQACKFGAIKEFSDVNDLPVIDWMRCTGCGQCVAACPGLAIFVVDETYSPEECLIAMPHEFVPLPERDQVVLLYDRAGRHVGEGAVHRVVRGKDKLATPVVWVRAPKALAYVARALGLPESQGRSGN